MKLIFKLSSLVICFCWTTSIYSQCNQCYITEPVKIVGKKFKCGTFDFFPIILNYEIEIYHPNGDNDPNHLFISRYHNYFSSALTSPAAVCSTTTIAEDKVLQDFMAIKAKGFNTIRLCGFYYQQVAVDLISNPPTLTNGAALSALNLSLQEYYSNYNLANDISPLINLNKRVLDFAQQAELKVIMLLPGNGITGQQVPDTLKTGYINYLQNFAKNFNGHPALLAVDFFNEPIYTSAAYGMNNKATVCDLTKSWNDAIKSNSEILTTIGLGNSSETMVWDPNILPVDFISFHPYPDRSLTLNNAINGIKSECLWYTNNVKKPWIIGETGYEADISNSSALADQATYLQQSLDVCRDYGGSGYSWWNFKDLNGSPASRWGLATFDETLTWKPAASYIASFNCTVNPSNTQPPNYFNYPNNNFGYVGKGQVLGQYSEGIKDAVIIARGIGQSFLGFTFSDNDGYFTLQASGYIKQFEVSAVDCSTIYDTNPNVCTTPHLPCQYPSKMTLNAPYILNKLYRPDNSDLTFSNQNVTNINSSQYADNTIQFNNYQVMSGTLKVKAGEKIKLNTGFCAKYGSFFDARIGNYYHDCSLLSAVGMRKINPSSEESNELVSGDISISPNPGNGIFNILADTEGEYFIEVTDVYGKKCKTFEFNGLGYVLNFSDFKSGLYFFRVIDKQRDYNKIFKIVNID